MVSNPSTNREARLYVLRSSDIRVYTYTLCFQARRESRNSWWSSCSRNEFNVGNSEEIKIIQVSKEYVRNIEFKYSIKVVLSLKRVSRVSEFLRFVKITAIDNQKFSFSLEKGGLTCGNRVTRFN